MIKLIMFTLLLVGCSKDGKVKHAEYLVNNQWQRCDGIFTDNCGIRLNCNGVVYYCMTNLQSRVR